MRKAPTVASLIEATERHFRLSPGSLLSEDRNQPLVSFRQLAMRVAYDAGYGYAWIGRAFKRDWTTVRANCNQALNRLRSGEVWWTYAKAELERVWLSQ